MKDCAIIHWRVSSKSQLISSTYSVRSDSFNCDPASTMNTKIPWVNNTRFYTQSRFKAQSL